MQISALRASADFGAQVQRAAERLVAERVYERILARDHTVWRPDPTEIANRLGWLDSPHVMRDAIDPIRQCHRRRSRRWLHPRPAVGHGRL